MQQGDPLVRKLNAEIKRKDALIRELVAALWQAKGVVDTTFGQRPVNLLSDIDAALVKAKQAGFTSTPPTTSAPAPHEPAA